jgi:CBS domain-containing protein
MCAAVIRPNATKPARRVVADVMTSAVVSAHESALFKEIAIAMARNRISMVPVLDRHRVVVGVVTAADMLARLSGERGPTPHRHRLAGPRELRRKIQARTASGLMTAPAITVNGALGLRAAAERFAHERVRCLPVVDDDGVLLGVVTKGDLLSGFVRDDDDIREEIVRHIINEAMLLDPAGIDVSVTEGVVSLSGTVERRLIAEQLVNSVREVPGVVDVDNAVSYRVDDVVTSDVWPRPV